MGGVMTTAGDLYDAVQDLRDEIQRLDQKVDALCAHAGLDPAAAGRLPDDPPPADRM
jgi:hypothetical protein